MTLPDGPLGLQGDALLWDTDAALLTGKVTKVAAPYLDFTVSLSNPELNERPSTCTLRYRALTAPAAKLLGAPPNGPAPRASLAAPPPMAPALPGSNLRP